MSETSLVTKRVIKSDRDKQLALEVTPSRIDPFDSTKNKYDVTLQNLTQADLESLKHFMESL